MNTRFIKVIPMFRADNYEQNYDRAIDRGADFNTTCICCGRKLNEKTMKMAQAIAPGYFVATDCPNIPEIISDGVHQEPMGWYSVGPVCYREIRRRIKESEKFLKILFYPITMESQFTYLISETCEGNLQFSFWASRSFPSRDAALYSALQDAKKWRTMMGGTLEQYGNGTRVRYESAGHIHTTTYAIQPCKI